MFIVSRLKEKKNKVIVIAGPTASGKTDLAIRLARHFNTKIISFDSRQCYREMCIGTAAPSIEEQQGIQHYFIQSHSIHEPVSAGKFKLLAENWLEEIFKTSSVAILTGGTGLYIQALIEGIHELPSVSPNTREYLQLKYKQEGLPFLQALVKNADPEYFLKADQQNPARLLRAAEIITETGLSYTSFLNIERSDDFPWNVEKYAIHIDRNILYERINARVDEMLRKGLLKEAESLYPFKSLSTLSTVGYSELFDFMDGKFNFDSAVELIKQHSRNYAKRQVTWFRNKGSFTFLSPEEIYAAATKGNS